MSVAETPLTEKGIEDAKKVGRLLRGYKFDRVLVSPYLRARQTQKYAMPDVEGEIVELLHEVDCGILEGRLYSEVLSEYEELATLIDIDDFTSFGGEDYANVRRRMRDFMAYLISLEAENVVAFTHAGVILTFFDEVMKREGKPGRNIQCSNGSVNVFEYKDGIWTIAAMNITGDLYN